jgi:hypothetical protein
VTGAGVVEQYAPHHLRGNREKLGATLPARLMLVAEPEPRFMDERRGLQSVAVSLTPQGELRLAPQLGVYEADERLTCLYVTCTPRSQEFGDPVRGLPLICAGACDFSRRWLGDTFGGRDRHTEFGPRYR